MKYKSFDKIHHMPTGQAIIVVECDEDYEDLEVLVGTHVVIYTERDVREWRVLGVENDPHPPPWVKGEKIGLRVKDEYICILHPWIPGGRFSVDL